MNGNQWLFTIKISEVAGVATTITGFNVNGTEQSSDITSFFGTNQLPAKGSLQAIWGLNVASAPTTIPVTLSGQDASGFMWTTALQVQLVGGPQEFAYIDNSGLVNAASFQTTYAPGMILSIFGINLVETNAPPAVAESLPLPLSLAGSSATINGVAAPYYYASFGQVNVQIPYETAPGIAILSIKGDYGETFNYAFKVQASAPGIFVDSTNDALVPSESGKPGDEIILYITGDGQTTPSIATGASPAPGTPLDQLPKPKLPVTVTVGNQKAQIVFLGIVPGVAGATQINYIIPPGTPAGVQPVVVTVGTVASPPAQLTVQ